MSSFRRFVHEGPTIRTFQRTFASRLPGPIGCLVVLLVCSVGLVLAPILIVWSLVSPRRKAATPFQASTPQAAAREEALRRLVRAMALDDTFTADEARQAGTLAAGGATVDELLSDAIERGWIERRGERLNVTRRGRDEAGG